MKKVLIIVPVYNPDNKFIKLLDALKKQSLHNASMLIIDSGSDKSYKKHIRKAEHIVIKEIPAQEFNHGGTRQWGIDLFPDKDIYIFFTQDAILADSISIERIVDAFENDAIGCAYGRQLPHKEANIFATLARNYNYPARSHVYSLKDKDKHGVKTVFISNSFAAYRKESMKQIGGFPTNTILSEDMYVAAKMVLCNWNIAYVSDACVYHSHNYTIWQEFKRYFDIGVFHSREKWIRNKFGKAEGEGVNFVINEIKYIIKHNPFLLANMIMRDGMKFLGYRLGMYEKYIPNKIKKIISMTDRYWC